MQQIFNRQQIRLRRDRAARLIDKHDFIINEVAQRLIERLECLRNGFDTVLNLGFSNGYLSELLEQRQDIGLVINQDISYKMLAIKECVSVNCDEESLPFKDKSFDLIISNLTLHNLNNVRDTLQNIKNLLKPNGIFIAAVYGSNTLVELRNAMLAAEIEYSSGASTRVMPFADIQAVGSLVQAIGFAEPVIDSDQVKASYTDVIDLMHDLRGMGETNVLTSISPPLTRELLMKIKTAAIEQSVCDEIIATFDIITITGLAARDNS